MSASAEEKRKELKAKLAAKTSGAHKQRKDTKEQAKAKEEADKAAKLKAEADKKEKVKLKAEADAKARAAAAAAPVSVWADLNDEASQIGIHIGISCDGCGKSPPIIGKAWKCKVCPDFDLCDKCYPERRDKAREAVCVKAGMPAEKGRHPAKCVFGPRKAGVVMTVEAVAKELAAAEADEKAAAAKAEAAAAPRSEVEIRLEKRQAEKLLREHISALSGTVNASVEKELDPIWRPCARMIAELPTPQGHPRVLRPPK